MVDRPSDGRDSVARCIGCDRLTGLRCGCCERPRCERHLIGGLCSRCEQAIARDRPRLAGQAWTAGGLAGAGVATASIAAGMFVGVFVGIPVGVAAGLGAYGWIRRRWMRRNGPELAATVGELPPPVAAEPFPIADGSDAG